MDRGGAAAPDGHEATDGPVVDPDIRMSIAAVERDTGISKDTLRVWERRYGFPDPGRDDNGERVYSLAQVGKLRLVRQLLDAGHRPGRVIGQPSHVLRALAEQAAASSVSVASTTEERSLDDLSELVRKRDAAALRSRLSAVLLRRGVEGFVHDCAAPLTHWVGDAWARGEIGVFEEHLYCECVQAVLRGAIDSIPDASEGPTVLLTTLPNELHGLGLLMAEAILSLEGCRCVPFGTQMPVDEIVRAAVSQRADIVGLSCSSLMSTNFLVDSLVELDARLPDGIAVWVGGDPQVGSRRLPARVEIVTDLPGIAARIDAWRAAQGSGTDIG